LLTTPIPAKKRLDGKAMAKVVEAWAIPDGRFADTDLPRKLAEDSAEIRFL
jgi:hypothetical protein